MSAPSVPLAPDGKAIAVATGSGEVVGVESETGRTLWRRPILAAAVTQIGFDPGGGSLVVAGEEETARVVTAVDDSTRAELPGSDAQLLLRPLSLIRKERAQKAARHVAHELRVSGTALADRIGKPEHPLPDRHLGQDAMKQALPGLVA